MLNKLLIALLTVVCSLQDAAALSLRTNTAEASELRRRNVDGEVSGGDSPGADGSASENEGCLDACTELAPCAGETRKQRIARNRRLRKELKDGMDAEEVVVNKYIRTMDFALMMPMMCFYVFFGWLNQGHWQNPEYAGLEMIDGVKISSGNEDARVGQMPTWLRGTTVILTMMSMFSLFRHAFDGAPVLKALGSTYKVMQTFGRWIFLTRWCLAFQMLHFMALGALAIKPDLWPLAGITPGCAPISGAIGSFVTVQFFSLVYPTRRFLDEIEDMKKLGYPQLWFYNMFTHSLPLPLAIFDAVFLEPEAMQWIPFPQMVLAITIWSSVYLVWIFFNFFRTGEWPYEVLVKNGLNPVKWGGFVAVQVTLICVFDIMLRSLRWATPRVW